MSDDERPPTTNPSQADVLGTWRFVRVTGGETGKAYPWLVPFYVRSYPDGTAATWPTPVAPITRGRYEVEDGELLLNDSDTKHHVRLRVSHDKMWFWNDDGDECLYYRVAINLQPGMML